MQKLMPDNLLTKIKSFFKNDDHMDDKPNNVSGGNKSGSVNMDEENRPDVAQAVITEDKSPAEEKKTETPVRQHSIEEVKEEVLKVLKTCYDPEIPVDIWELGLVYDIKIAENHDVLIVMTLTSPSCPVAGILPAEVEQKVKEHPMVHDCKVQLTFDPPWNQNMMSEVAKLELGFL